MPKYFMMLVPGEYSPLFAKINQFSFELIDVIAAGPPLRYDKLKYFTHTRFAKLIDDIIS